MTPIKLNRVVVRNFNEEDMLDLARPTLENDWDVRFLEMMPFGEISDFQQTTVVTFQVMRARVEAAFGPLEEASYDFVDPSRPFRIPGAMGTLGFISSVTEPFCQGCGRVRLTADGKLRLCLLREDEVDLLTPLRAGASGFLLKDTTRDELTHAVRVIAGGNALLAPSVTKRLITPWKSPDDKALIWLLECQAEGDRLLKLEVEIDWGEPLTQRMVDGLLVAQRDPEPARGIYAQSNAESTRIFGNPHGRPDQVDIDDASRARLIYHVPVNGIVEVPLIFTVSDVGEQLALSLIPISDPTKPY